MDPSWPFPRSAWRNRGGGEGGDTALFIYTSARPACQGSQDRQYRAQGLMRVFYDATDAKPDDHPADVAAHHATAALRGQRNDECRRGVVLRRKFSALALLAGSDRNKATMRSYRRAGPVSDEPAALEAEARAHDSQGLRQWPARRRVAAVVDRTGIKRLI
jgi:hypothetical protein